MKNHHHISTNLLWIWSIVGTFLIVNPVLAHHGMGNMTPDNFLSGLISGLAHPVIGLDHLSFVIGIGLLSSLSSWGIIIPLGFVLTSIIGTAIHLMNIDLPVTELIIAVSVLISGLMLLTSKVFY